MPPIAVKIVGASHQSFSDGPILNPGQHRTSAPIDPVRAIHVVSAYVRAFFDRFLLGRPLLLLTGPAPAFPEVEVEVIR